MSPTARLICGVDPGPETTAYVVWDQIDRHIECRAVVPTPAFLTAGHPYDQGQESQTPLDMAIEVVEGYGMSVGMEVFRTVEWTGRFIERCIRTRGTVPRRVTRKEVKLHLCGTYRANDAAIRDALIEKFGPGKERAIGKTNARGPLYGITGDLWAALAVAITAAETPMTPAGGGEGPSRA